VREEGRRRERARQRKRKRKQCVRVCACLFVCLPVIEVKRMLHCVPWMVHGKSQSGL
jgi:hypothetical protein